MDLQCVPCMPSFVTIGTSSLIVHNSLNKLHFRLNRRIDRSTEIGIIFSAQRAFTRRILSPLVKSQEDPGIPPEFRTLHQNLRSQHFRCRETSTFVPFSCPIDKVNIAYLASRSCTDTQYSPRQDGYRPTARLAETNRPPTPSP